MAPKKSFTKKADPKSEASMIANLTKKLTDKGMPIKMAKSVAAKQAKAKDEPKPKGKKPAVFKAKKKKAC